MEYIRVTKENLEQEHICCAISNNKDVQVSSKKVWVSGSFKGHGYSNDLLDECIQDSKEKGKSGLCILSSAKKKPFLADPKFLAHKGFKECARHPKIAERGYVLTHPRPSPPTLSSAMASILLMSR